MRTLHGMKNRPGRDARLFVASLASAMCLSLILLLSPAAETTRGEAASAPPQAAAAAAPTYYNYAPPVGLGANAGEPSIGVNHNTGKVFYVANSQTLRVTYDECSSPAKARWEDVSPPDRTGVTLDPILYTDPVTGRTFTSQLLGKVSEMFYSDNDGASWSRSQGAGINSGVDHQTIGSGPFAPPLTGAAGYPRAVYYCSQDAAVAQCALSLDGGRTFGPAVPMYVIAQCAGIHGHVKVAPDGTAYIPNKACELKAQTPITTYGKQAVIVSENNGATWEVRMIPDSTAVSGIIDPSVGIGRDGTVYFAYRNGDGRAKVAVSRDHGRTWAPSKDVGAALGVQNITFPEAVAGDGDRAAVAFLGTTTGGNYQAPIRTGTAINPAGFRGEWHLYVATTYDRGETWTTVDATPDDPVQRGSICNSGTACSNTPNDRNLLDFNDMTVDAEGRVLVAYADGCVTDACRKGLDLDGDGFKDNDYSAAARIARQVTGPRLFAAFDPPASSAPPGAPNVTATRNGGGVVRLSWPAPDDHGSPVTAYRVYRRAAPDAYPQTPLATVTTNSYTDESADSSTRYFYKVTAVNALGEGAACGEAEPAPAFSACDPPGIPVVDDVPKDSLDLQECHDIRYIAVSEPASAGAGNIVFTMKMASLSTITPNTTWPINFIAPDGKTYFARMQTSATNAVTFSYGTGSTSTAALPASNYKPDGTIQVVVPAGGVGVTAAGQKLRGFLSRVQVVAVTPDNAPNSLAGTGEYTVVGSASCAPNMAPLAALRATPPAGSLPFTTTLDASASTDADDSVAAYTFNFGDGSAPVTRTVAEFGAEAARAAHTYTAPGSYGASVAVRDSRGKMSINTAAVVVTVDDGSCTINFALSQNGARATSSSVYPSRDYSPAGAIDGDRSGLRWGSGGGWNDATRDGYPDWLQVDFDGAKRIHEIRVHTLANDLSAEPTALTPATVYGLLDFEVQYWDGSQWVTVGSATGNGLASRSFAFPEVTTTKARVLVHNAREHFSRVVEFEALGCNAQ
ncbi:MAG TPA: PKD domain-containing protein [Pyrinomonadaceae bacterium]